MNNRLLFLLALCAAATPSFGQDLLCRVMLVDLDFGDPTGIDVNYDPTGTDLNYRDGYIYLCETDSSQENDGANRMVYSLDLPESFLESHREDLETGEAVVSISDGQAVREHDGLPPYIFYPFNAMISVVKDSHRRLERGWKPKIEGVSRLLVIRVTARDVDPVVSQELLSGRIFGVGEQAEAVSVVSQIGDCSFSKLRLEPAQGPDITDGVGELSVPWDVDGSFISTMENQLTSLTEAKFGSISDNFEHVVYCIPPGTKFNAQKDDWFAYAYLASSRSYFNGEVCGSLSALIHEIGHNWGLRHSRDWVSSYGDLSGYMGSSSFEVGGPASCFNGHKNWLLGWYKDKTIELNLDEKSWGGNLYAFTDYDKVPDDGVVVIKFGSVHVQWNRAEGFNSGTREHQNQVTVASAPFSTSHSTLTAGIANPWVPGSDGVSERFLHWENDYGHHLVIEVCDTVYAPPGQADYVRMSIYITGYQTSTCSTNLLSDSPSGSPTASSALPSSLPSAAPSPEPTSVQSQAPSVITKGVAAPAISPSTNFVPSQVPTVTPALCEDQKGNFWVDQETKDQLLTCVELAALPDVIEKVCHNEHQAYQLCPDTCRKCIDNCNDSPGTFFVNRHWGNQTCAWLVSKPAFQKFLCQPKYDAFHMCGESCDTCDVGAPDDDTCHDSPGTFFVNRHWGQQTCAWLVSKPAFQKFLCRPKYDAFHMCSEICDTCDVAVTEAPTSPPSTPARCDGKDSDETFFVNSNHGKKSCSWLAKKPGYRNFLCRPNFEAYSKCGETCDSCESVPSSAPSTPSISAAPTGCEDTDGTFWVQQQRHSKDCMWLRRRTNERTRDQLCQESHVRAICPELCGACTDDCEDDPDATFEVPNHGDQTCKWLSIRPVIAKKYCADPSHPAYELCGETCDTCH
jgi:hypothetical protein